MIHIDPKVVDYLKHKHSHCITIKTVEGKGGCGIPVEPQVEIKEPKNLERFDHFEVDNVDIYLKKGLSVDEHLYFKLSSILGLKSIKVTGLNFI
jgi:hypothetical protein